MVQALKAGETVTVSKDVQFGPNTPEYKNGLRSIKAGDIGTVVDAATGRSVIVEFGGKRTTIGSQRLERSAAPIQAPVNAPVATSAKMPESAAPAVRKRAAKPATAKPQTAENPPVPTSRKKVGDDNIANVPTVAEGNRESSEKGNEEGSTELVATLANSVLLSGGLKSAQDTVLQIRLSELPHKLQALITELVQAKLELGTKKSSTSATESGTATPGKGRRRRGRKS